jgi:hypothetical protein
MYDQIGIFKAIVKRGIFSFYAKIALNSFAGTMIDDSLKNR